MKLWLLGSVFTTLSLIASWATGSAADSTPKSDRVAVEVSPSPAATGGPSAATELPSLVREDWDRFGRARIPMSTPPDQTPKHYLPDSTLMARVGDRAIRAGDMRMRYFEMPSDGRPQPDSLGRIEFLQVLVNKELMGLVARKVNPPLGFEQRAELRENTATVLQNTLYQRMVVDSINITEEELARAMTQFDNDVRIRRILLDDRATAERVRRELLRGSIPWAAAVKKYSQANDSLFDGDLGWFRRSKLEGESALKIFDLAVGKISEPLQDSQGFHLVQMAERRKSDPPPIRLMRRMLIRDLRDARSTPLVRRMYARARGRARLEYDSTTVLSIVERFRPEAHRTTAPPGVPLRIVNKAPGFTPEDRARVVARTANKSITLGDFLEEYSHIPAVFRRPIVSLDPFIFTFEAIFLGPALAEMAAAHGLERDPLAVMQIEERREKLMVERVYADSIENHVRITEPMRRAEYERELKSGDLVTPLTVRFALIIRRTQEGADSVMTQLKAKVPADSIIAWDELRAGPGLSQMHEAVYGKPNTYGTIVFEELKPGQSTVLGPDAENKFMVIHVTERREEYVLPYDQALSAVDESTRNVEADRLFLAFLARHRGDHPQSMRADLVMKVNLNDPLMD